MANLEALSSELLAWIVSFSDRRSLAQLRLTNKRLENIAVVKLFERATLYAHWATLSEEELEDISAQYSRDYYGNDREGYVPRRDSTEQHRRKIQYDAEDGFIAGSDEDEEDGSVASSDKEEDGSVASSDDEEDGFVAGSDDEEDGFVADSDEDGEVGFVAGSDKDEEDSFIASSDEDEGHGFVAGLDEEEDDFIAGSDEDEEGSVAPEPDLQGKGRSGLNHRTHPRGQSSLQEQDPDSKAGDRPPRPDPFSGRLSDFQLYEKQRRQEWEANRPQWTRDNLPGPADYDAAVFLNIINDKRLRNFVKEVEIYTCETHCDHHPKSGSDLYRESWPEPRFHPRYISSIQRIGEFPNVCGINIHFDRNDAYDELTELFQDSSFQSFWLEKITQATKETTKHLGVRHLANSRHTYRDLRYFMGQVSTASSLRLSVKHAEVHPDSGTLYKYGNIHSFWETFPAQFLIPASTTLTTLILYSDLPLGWFPKLDLRAVHFPKLLSLTFGHHVMHDHQKVDWIVSHSETLRELIFDRCSILYQMGCNTPQWLDDGGYPMTDELARPNLDDPNIDWKTWGRSEAPEDKNDWKFGRTLLFKSTDLRWSTVFSRLASSLPRLCEFRFGSSSQWNFNTPSIFYYSGSTTHMPIMPWEDEHNIKSRLFKERYIIWDDWENEYRSKWIKKDRRGRNEFGVGWRDEWLALAEEYPKCDKEDREALQALLESIKGR